MGRLADYLSPAAVSVLTKAQTLADQRKEPLGSAHVAFALANVDRTVAYDLIKQASVQPVKLTKLPATKQPADEIPKLVEEAARVARGYGFSRIEPEHLLFAVLQKNKTAGSHLLKQCQVDTALVLERLNDWLYGASILSTVNAHPSRALGESQPGLQNQPSIIATTTTNLTLAAKNRQLDPVVGRNNEIESLVRTLLRRKKNNPLLIGDPGVGKTALVHGLAQAISHFNVPARLQNTTVLELSVPALISGTMYRGQFEERFRQLQAELQGQGNTILFIDEIHTITGTGSTEGALDLANLLKPLLASGEITVIGATTIEEYTKFFAPDRALERRFQPINVLEPTPTQAIPMVRAAAKHIAAHHAINITPTTIKDAVYLSTRYLPDRSLPDKALDILDEAAATIQQHDRASDKIKQLNQSLANLLERKFALVEKGQLNQASKLRHKEEQLQQALAKASKPRKQNAPTLDTAQLVAVVSQMTQIPPRYIQTDTEVRLEPATVGTALTRHLVGQRPAINAISRSLTRAELGLNNARQPIASFLFVGPTGTGKTETARLVAKQIFGSDNALIKVDMSELGEKHTVSQLIGSPKGYVGYDDTGTLVDRVRRQPFSVVLFDEVEKAHPDIFNLLLQILEDGVLTDTHQRQAHFEHCIIILTSNLGTEFFDQNSIGFTNSQPITASLIDQEIADFFRPELLGRLTETIHFEQFTPQEITQLVNRRIKVTINRLKNRHLTLKVDRCLVPYLVAQYDPAKGARSVDEVVTNHLDDAVVTALNTQTGNYLVATLDQSNQPLVQVLTR